MNQDLKTAMALIENLEIAAFFEFLKSNNRHFPALNLKMGICLDLLQKWPSIIIFVINPEVEIKT